MASMSGEGRGPGLAVAGGRAHRGAHGQGHAAARRRPLRAAARAGDTALRFPGKAGGSAGRVVRRRRTPRPRSRHLGPIETERAQVGGPGALNEPQGVLVAPPRWSTASASTSSSQTRSTTSSREFAWQTARSTSWRGPASSCASAPAAVRPSSRPLSTPWDLAWFEGRAVMAMAGTHQLWAWTPGSDRRRGRRRGRSAARRTRGCATAPAAEAWFAQPSGLATSDDGAACGSADSETSALRSVRRDATASSSRPTSAPASSTSATATATPTSAAPAPARRDGAARRLGRRQRHLQRCLRRYDPATDQVTTLARASPSRATPSSRPTDAGRCGSSSSSPRRTGSSASPCPRTRNGSTGWPVAPSGPHTAAVGRVSPEVVFEPPGGAEARPPLGRPDPARRVRHAGRVAVSRSRQGRGTAPAPWSARGHRLGRRCTSRCRRRRATATRARARCPSTQPATSSSRTGASPSPSTNPQMPH